MSVMVRPLASAPPVFVAVIEYAIACPDATGAGFAVTATVITPAAPAGTVAALAESAGVAARPVTSAGVAARPVIRAARAGSGPNRPLRKAASRAGDRGRLALGMVITGSPLSAGWASPGCASGWPGYGSIAEAAMSRHLDAPQP